MFDPGNMTMKIRHSIFILCCAVSSSTFATEHSSEVSALQALKQALPNTPWESATLVSDDLYQVSTANTHQAQAGHFFYEAQKRRLFIGLVIHLDPNSPLYQLQHIGGGSIDE